MNVTLRIILSLSLLCVLFTEGKADIIFPSRLEITEIEPGRFRVTFILPIVNGMKLKAEPVLPDFFQGATDHQISGTAASFMETWEVSGQADSLYGRRVGVRGLIGTPIDILLQIDLLNGRSYAKTLKPGNAFFVIPRPPGPAAVLGRALLDGARDVLSRPELWLLLLLLVFGGLNRRSFLPLVLVFVLARGAAQWLTAQQWMQLPQLWPILGAALLAAGTALARYREKIRTVAELPSLWGWMATLGAMYGTVGMLTTGPVSSELSRGGQYLDYAGQNIGAGLGLTVLFLLWWELRQGLTLTPALRFASRQEKRLWYFGALLAAGLFFYYGSSLVFYPSLIPEAPPVFFITALVVGGWLAAAPSGGVAWQPLLLLLLAGLGLAAGFLGYRLPLGVAGVLLFFTSAVLLIPRAIPRPVQWVLAGPAVFFAAGQSGAFVEENLSFAIAQAVGFTALAFLVGLIGFSWVRFRPGSSRWLGITGMAAALLFRAMDYVEWVNREVMTELALGRLVLPLLSMLLAALAVFLWPRRRVVHALLGVEKRASYTHLLLLGLAFFLLPLGTLSVANPFYEATAPRDEQAARILEQVLGNTYHAFNLEQEDRLYDQLAASVSENLIADIYLDSRRRLTTGVREGAEVTVKTVEVESVGEEVQGVSPTEGFTYQCRWSVTARVRHLQHIHHRRNIYSGDLRIKVIDNAWKIDQLSLKSEDRVIIPGRQGS